MVDMKEMDERGRLRHKINSYITTANIEDVRDTLDFMELRYEVKQASVTDIKGEHEGEE